MINSRRLSVLARSNLTRSSAATTPPIDPCAEPGAEVSATATVVTTRADGGGAPAGAASEAPPSPPRSPSTKLDAAAIEVIESGVVAGEDTLI